MFSLVAASQGQDERCHTRHPTTPHDIGLPLRLPTAAWGEPQVAANDALRQAARCYNMTDQNLVLLRRQYLQLFEPDFISWPPPALLRNDDVQTWLFRHLFDPVRNPVLPPARYQRLVLDNLVRRIVKATGDRSVRAILPTRGILSMATLEVPKTLMQENRLSNHASRRCLPNYRITAKTNQISHCPPR